MISVARTLPLVRLTRRRRKPRVIIMSFPWSCDTTYSTSRLSKFGVDTTCCWFERQRSIPLSSTFMHFWVCWPEKKKFKKQQVLLSCLPNSRKDHPQPTCPQTYRGHLVTIRLQQSTIERVNAEIFNFDFAYFFLQVATSPSYFVVIGQFI